MFDYFVGSGLKGLTYVFIHVCYHVCYVCHVLYVLYVYCMYIYVYIYIYIYMYIYEQVRIVDDNEKSVFKHDRFLMSFQVFRSYIATIMFYLSEVV